MSRQAEEALKTDQGIGKKRKKELSKKMHLIFFFQVAATKKFKFTKEKNNRQCNY